MLQRSAREDRDDGRLSTASPRCSLNTYSTVLFMRRLTSLITIFYLTVIADYMKSMITSKIDRIYLVYVAVLQRVDAG